jgi:hypothetical protein
MAKQYTVIVSPPPPQKNLKATLPHLIFCRQNYWGKIAVSNNFRYFTGFLQICR